MKKWLIALIPLFLLPLLMLGAGAVRGFEADLSKITAMPNNPGLMRERPENLPAAYFAGGCFWCMESEFRPLPGVVYTRAGYMGGKTENPTYEQIGTETTGHAETTEIVFDPAQISYTELLTHFMTHAHNPTELNRQGADVGPQYRSAIFYTDDAQKREAEDVIKSLTHTKHFKKPITTTLESAADHPFWPAEEYHQQYYEKYEQRTGEPHIRILLKKQKLKN